MTEQKTADGITAMIGDLVAANYDGDVRGIALIIANKEGHLQTRIGYMPGSKLPLLAGTVLLQRQMADMASILPDAEKNP